MLKPIIYWGASGHAKVLHEFSERAGYDLIALVDNNPDMSPPFAGIPLVTGRAGFLAWRAEHMDIEPACAVAIGGDRGRDRLEILEFLHENGCAPATLIHPAAYLAGDVRVGWGCQVLAHATVCADAALGSGCIINTAASVDHECVLGAGVHIAPGATLAGCVTVGDFTLVAVGAKVLPRVHIGHDAIVGAGAVVTRDVPDGAIVYGNPARIRRMRQL